MSKNKSSKIVTIINNLTLPLKEAKKKNKKVQTKPQTSRKKEVIKD